MKKHSAADYRRMPWKNGAGTTIEIAVDPGEPGGDGFSWRVSRATVAVDGAFSHFEGIDRSLALLSGAGLRLDVASTTLTVDHEQNIVQFPGDLPTHAVLIDGPIDDFNLMTRRTRCRHSLHHWQGAGSFSVPADTVLIYCATGRGSIDAMQSRTTLSTDESVLMEIGDTLTGAKLHADHGARFYCVEIHWQEFHDNGKLG